MCFISKLNTVMSNIKNPKRIQLFNTDKKKKKTGNNIYCFYLFFKNRKKNQKRL